MDASGSLEAVKAALNSLPQDRVGLRFLHAAAGPVTATDIDLAAAADGALIVAFNTPVSEAVLASAKSSRACLPPCMTRPLPAALAMRSLTAFPMWLLPLVRLGG